MTEASFYKSLLNLDSNWDISDVELDMSSGIILVHLKFISKIGICPVSKQVSSIYDYSPERKWRHLDTMQYQTWLVARVPRVINGDDKISTIEVPWADFSERYTFLFSAAIIQLLQLTKNQTKTAQFFNTTFDVVHGIMSKAVERGLRLRSKETAIDSIGIDEKSFKRGHDYCTIVTDSTNKRVLEVVHGRTKESAKNAINQSLSIDQQERLKTVTGDMWEAYQNSVKECLPAATYVLDRFHLIKYLNHAIDQTRRAEVKEVPQLKNARFALLKNAQNLTEKQRIQFTLISQENYLVSHVWKAKENFKAMFGQPDQAHAAIILGNWFNELKNYTIKPLTAVKEMFERHRVAIASALCHAESNAYAERTNGTIQELKTIAKGFRNVENFRIAILFHCGKLDLIPTRNFL